MSAPKPNRRAYRAAATEAPRPGLRDLTPADAPLPVLRPGEKLVDVACPTDGCGELQMAVHTQTLQHRGPKCRRVYAAARVVEHQQRLKSAPQQPPAAPQGADPNPTAPWPGTAPAAPSGAPQDPPAADPGPAAPRDPLARQRLRQSDAARLRALGISPAGTGLAGADSARVLTAAEVERRGPKAAEPTPEDAKRRAKQDAALRRAGILPGGGIVAPGGGGGFNPR